MQIFDPENIPSTMEKPQDPSRADIDYQLYKLTQQPTTTNVKQYLYGNRLLMEVYIHNYEHARMEMSRRSDGHRDECIYHLDQMLERCQAILETNA